MKAMKHIAILDLNPGVDRVIYLDGAMQPGTMNRAAYTRFSQGSKAINQAILLARLGGCAVDYYTFTGGVMGRAYLDYLDHPAITVHAVETAAGVRVNTKVIDGDGISTELNERGGPVSANELAKLKTALADGCGDVDILSLAGSIPQGVEKDVYKCIIEAGTAPKVILDCDGEQLKLAVSGENRVRFPALIKPNRRELAGLCDALGIAVSHEFSTGGAGLDAVVAACGEVCRKTRGETDVICTLDAEGSVYVGRDGRYLVSAPTVPFRGFSGAGDSYLAAYMYAREVVGCGVVDALRFASAAASAKVALEGTALPERGEIDALVEKVEIVELK